jgi:PmbA protein
MSIERKTALALQAEAAALGSPGVVAVEESVYSDEEEHIAMASTLGVRAESMQSYGFVYAVAHAGLEMERQTGLGFDAARDPAVLDAGRAGREAGQKAAALVGARQCKTGAYTLVLDREVASALLSTVVQALSADAVLKGRSVFAGRLGGVIGSAGLTLVDDGLRPEGMATCPFDGEGVPQQTTTLVEEGVLRSFLYDHRSARREGGDARSTGSARRSSYRTLPRVGSSNLVVRPGTGSLSDLLKRVGEGLYVESVAGLHSGVNPVSGEISVGISGRLIEGGVAGTPVREVTIATDFVTLLSSVCDMAGDSRWIPFYGSVNTPSLAIGGVTVSGA